jgi:hypothetical protein
MRTDMHTMENDRTSPIKSNLLPKIVSAYADIWADVILERNLDFHLKVIDYDLVRISSQIAKREAANENPIHHYRVAKQLYRMREIIQRKIMGKR